MDTSSFTLKTKNKEQKLCALTVCELLLCGSGQILRKGEISMRIILFGLCLLVTFLIIIKHKAKFSYSEITIQILLFLWFGIGLSFGLINNGSISNIMIDVKSFIYFLIFPFFLLTINNEKIIHFIIRLLRNIPLLMAVIYLIYLIAIKSLGIITFSETYEASETQSDFMFRGTSGELLYKGFVFLPISVIFWLQRKKIIPILIILIAIFFTYTRGLYLITLIGMVCYFLHFSKSYTIRTIIISIVILGCIVAPIFYTSSFEERASGDMIRVITFQQVEESINLISLTFGHGLGIGVDIRPVHMENSFLEIFHKTGLFGIFVWLLLLFYIWRNYSKNRNAITFNFYLCACMIYIQSIFNPYLTNSMGMGFVFICYCITAYYKDFRRIC